MPRRRSWIDRARIASIAVATPLLIVLFVLSIPFALPFVAITERRAFRRKHILVKTWPCSWCVAPLGIEALTRADALSDAYAREAFSQLMGEQPLIVRELHACCPRCDAGHRYDEPSNCFLPLHARAFGRMFGEMLHDVVPPATAKMAWPWLASSTPMHSVTLTRDSVCLADDIEPSRNGSVEVPATADVAAIAEALLRSPWLAHVGANATWWCSFGSTRLIFGLRASMPFVRRLGANPLAAADIVSLHMRYAAQADPDDLRQALAESEAEPPSETSAEAVTTPVRKGSG